MNRIVYILLLLLSSVNFWYLEPFGRFLVGNCGLFVLLAFIIFGGIYYYLKTPKPMLLIMKGYYLPVLLIFGAVLLSFIPAYVNHGQGLLTSALASKVMLVYLALPALLIVRPSFKDIELALYAFSAIFLIITVLDSLLGVPIIEKIEGISVESTREYISEEDFVHKLEGVHFVGMAFIFSLSHLKKQFSIANLVITFTLLAIIFLIQNRSTLFSCVLFLIYTLLTIQHKKYKVIIRTSVLMLTLSFLLLTLQYWIALFDQTVIELGNEGYNRNLAMAYFLFEASPDILSFTLGNGFLSSKTTSLMQDMMEYGIYNSDVGFVGLWNQYGLISVFVFGYLLAKVIFAKEYNFVLKCNAWFIVACGLTTAYFAQDCKIIWVCLFLYMYSAEDYLLAKKNVNTALRRHWRRRILWQIRALF